MKKILTLLTAFFFFLIHFTVQADPVIPAQAWSRDISAGTYQDGVSIGGFGAGTITWRDNGIFYKDRLKIGHVGSGGNGSDNITFTDDATARFYLYQKTSGAGTATVKKLDAATLGAGQAKYYALFPMSWVDYYGSQFNVKAKVTQFSPIIPNDYQRVSYPMGIYEWEITNPSGTQAYDASIMLTWNNDYSGVSATAVTSGNFKGIVLHRTGAGAPTLETEGEFALGSLNGNGVTVTVMSSASVANIVTDFTADGMLSNTTGNNTIGAVAFSVTLAPGASVRVPIVLAWDIPIYQVGTGNKWWKKYTRFFGRTGRNAWAMITEALTNCASWEAQVDAWQDSVLTSSSYPEWLKTTLFNELYIYFTGGTVWEAGAASGQPDDPAEDMFSHLESYIYMFYGTSDVRFYGSWALFMNWPDIDKQAVKQFCDSVQNTRTDRAAGEGTCAHDLGGIYAWNPPGNTCVLNGTQDQWYLFDIYNCYRWRSACDWKDLNSKLVLMVYRDWKLSGSTDTAFLNYCYGPIKTAMAKVRSQDTDGDGMPNSAGIDQTYDDMDLTGNTAYCGGLFLAACEAAKELAIASGDTLAANTYQGWFNLAQPNYESKLWTGTYYKIDTGSTNTLRIMSDQLCGQWYAKACGLPGIVSDAHAVTAFQTMYDNNFLKFGAGAHGLVNVMLQNGTIDTGTSQSQECWVGTSWGAAAGMIQQGMAAQADAIGQSLYNTIWNTSQLGFRTPEAWTLGVAGQRAYYYMRGTTIWAVKRAYDLMSGPTPTNTITKTSTPVISPTNTPYYSPTPTQTPVSSPTYTYTKSPTFTGTSTSTVTPTLSRTATATGTQPPTQTNTPVNTVTLTWANTQTMTPVNTATNTATNTPVNTVTNTFVNTPAQTPGNTQTNTPQYTATNLPLNSPTSTVVDTATETFTNTPVNTVTPTPGNTASFTVTLTRTATPANTPVNTATRTQTASINTATRTVVLTATYTPPAATLTFTATPAPTVYDGPVVIGYPYPNPVNPSNEDVSMGVTLDMAMAEVKVRLFTVDYRLVREIRWRNLNAGFNLCKIEKAYLSGLSNGVYYYVIFYEGGRTKLSTVVIVR